MKKLTSKQKIFFELHTVLIDDKNNCQLRQSKEFNCFYMISNKTGIHTLTETENNDRVKAHWNGFLINQI